MGVLAFVRTKQYRNFMAKLYGWGASVVIIGALFKINHYWGADTMLIIGLGTESIIFFFSAFEPPHVEPDWSLVYPQLAGMYHDGNMDVSKALATGETVTQELDKMLSKAKIGPELIQSLGDGLRNLNDTTSQLSDVSNAALANDQFVNTLNSATQSASSLNDSYKKSAKSLEQNVSVTEEQLHNMQAASKNAANLSNAYNQIAATLQDEANINKEFKNSISNVAASANKFVEKYNESSEILSRTTESLSTTATESANYSKQLHAVSNNLGALNAMYELHLKGSNAQMETANKYNEILKQLVGSLNESSATTAKYKDNLQALNQAVEKQVQSSILQSDSAGKMQESMKHFLANLNESVEKTALFKTEVDALARNIAALNKVYGNMLSAMNVNMK
jgi:gliding motility-associated protein GldL